MTESVSIIPIGNKFKVHVTGRKHALRCFKNYEESIVTGKQIGRAHV